MDEKTNTTLDDKEPERYYDWMLWKMRQEERKMKIMTKEEMMKKEIAEMQSSVHHLQMRVKELSEETEAYKQENANLKRMLSKRITDSL